METAFIMYYAIMSSIDAVTQQQEGKLTLDRSPELFLKNFLSICIYWKLAMLLVTLPTGGTIFVHKAII